jgi:hypothetical protein
MTNTIEPMDLTNIYYVESGDIELPKIQLTLKEGKKLYIGKERLIIDYIYEVLPNEQILQHEVSYINNNIYLIFRFINIEMILVLLFKHKIIDDIKIENLQDFFCKEWEKYQANFKNYIINKIINQ